MKNRIIVFILLTMFISTCSNEASFNPIEITQNNNLLDMYTGEPIQLTDDLYILNIWASWCLECIQEHQEFIELSRNQNLENKIIFVLFQDSKENAIDFVDKYGRGNIIFSIDPNSRLSIDLGVFGVPETFIVHNLEVKKKFIGPTNLLSIQTEINNISK
tara:strand:+ start:197 stop:676 length:480 start_codon:yes stop_codon:yes gene_type:complete